MISAWNEVCFRAVEELKRECGGLGRVLRQRELNMRVEEKGIWNTERA